MRSHRARTVSLTAAALAAVAALALTLAAGGAAATQRSHQISKHLCETTGGGRFVAVPGWVAHSPGAKVDVRLLNDIREINNRWPIYIYSGYEKAGHAAAGEHPIGLALDIGPTGRSWKQISALAEWAEPHQDRPRAPFRWVGYNGDSGHGKGDHLHLSWNHGASRFGKPVKTVYTRDCPDPELQRADKLIRAEGMIPLKISCDRRGGRFICPYRGARFKARSEQTSPAQLTEICEGDLIQRKPYKKRSVFRRERCATSDSASSQAKQLARYLTQQMSGAGLSVRSTRCWPISRKWRCLWRAGYAYGDARGSATRSRPVRGSEWEIKRSD